MVEENSMTSTKSVQGEARAMTESDASKVCMWKEDRCVSRMRERMCGRESNIVNGDSS